MEFEDSSVVGATVSCTVGKTGCYIIGVNIDRITFTLSSLLDDDEWDHVEVLMN